jgi:hypothetical protein
MPLDRRPTPGATATPLVRQQFRSCHGFQEGGATNPNFEPCGDTGAESRSVSSRILLTHGNKAAQGKLAFCEQEGRFMQ